MNKAFEKILDKLEESYIDCFRQGDYKFNNAIDKAKQIVQEVAEEYKDGWIPCSERLPEEYGEYIVWWTDITKSKYYEIVEYEPSNGWIGDIPQSVEGKYSVIAWQPLPEPYKERD